MGIETQVYTQLAATSALTDEVGARIYRHQRPRETSEPCVVFRRFTSEIVNHSTGASDTQYVTITVDSYAADMDDARTVADAVTTAISGWSNTGGTPSISMCHQISELENPDYPDHGSDALAYRITQDYRISHHS